MVLQYKLKIQLITKYVQHLLTSILILDKKKINSPHKISFLLLRDPTTITIFFSLMMGLNNKTSLTLFFQI